MIKNIFVLCCMFSLIAFNSGRAGATENFPSVGTNTDDSFCISTWTTNGKVDQRKCFPSGNYDEQNTLRWKINELSKANTIPNDKFWNLVKDSTSLKDAYFRLGQAYPIKQTCELIETKHQEELKSYEYSSSKLNCNVTPSGDNRHFPPATR